MDKIYVIYWSQSGNTMAMAKAIGAGVEEAGKQAEVVEVGDITAGVLKDASVFALGSPAMGAEVIEEEQMEPFVAEVEQFAKGKKVALFGSYGWGDGEWMREWTCRMTEAGADVINGEGVICQDTPDDRALEQCKALGKRMAEA